MDFEKMADKYHGETHEANGIQWVKEHVQFYQHPKTSENEKKESNSICALQPKF
jgi:hypothetical protein